MRRAVRKRHRSRASCSRTTPFSHSQGAPLACSLSASAFARAVPAAPTQGDVVHLISVESRHRSAGPLHCYFHNHCFLGRPDCLGLHAQGDSPWQQATSPRAARGSAAQPRRAAPGRATKRSSAGRFSATSLLEWRCSTLSAKGKPTRPLPARLPRSSAASRARAQIFEAKCCENEPVYVLE